MMTKQLYQSAIGNKFHYDLLDIVAGDIAMSYWGISYRVTYCKPLVVVNPYPKKSVFQSY